jgi:hypothetical protein
VGVTERCGEILSMNTTFQNKKKLSISTNVRKHVKMSSIRSNARLDVSSGTAESIQRCWGLAGSLTGIYSAMVKCLSAVNRSCRHKGLQVSPTGRNPQDSKSGIQRGGHAVGLPLPVHRARQVLLRTSRIIMHVPHSCS